MKGVDFLPARKVSNNST